MIQVAKPDLGEPELTRIREVVESGMIADGPEVRAFEREFAEYCGVEHAVATANGTAALHAALHALGVGAGDQVLTTPFSFVASANAARLVGAEPVFSDIEPATFNIDPESVEQRVAEGDVDAILAVHLYGLPASLDRLQEIAEAHSVPLVEDAAQAHGAEFQGRRVGSFGDVACFSFYPTKNMTTGEGGMVVTDRSDLAERLRRFVNHGRTSSYEHATVGHNFRMSSISAAIGRIQLEKLDDFVEARRANAAGLSAGLEAAPVTLPSEPADRRHAYHQYTVRSPDRDGLRAHLEANDVGSGVYYPRCIHEQPAYDDVRYESPAAEAAAREVLSLPVHPGVTAGDVDHIIEVIHDYAT